MAGIDSASVMWEAVYKDGTVLREAQGAVYRQIDRVALNSFRIVAPGEIVSEMFMDNGRSGFNFVYRRRTILNSSRGKTVWFVMGFVPQGPVVAVQPESLQFMEGQGFSGGAGPLGRVVPIVAEGELWTNEMMGHKTDGRLTNETIVLPSGYTMKAK